MIELSAFHDVRKILALGAHCDDIEIGCGGLLSELALSKKRALHVLWIVLSSDDVRKTETRNAAFELAGQSNLEFEVMHFRNGYFPYVGAEIKDYFEELKGRFDPDLVLTHYNDDRHQDHRVTSELTWNTFRKHMILEYEIPKYDGGLSTPNCYYPLHQDSAQRKVNAITKHFESQKDKQWFDARTFLATMRLRGIECNSDSGYAEGFYARKMLIS